MTRGAMLLQTAFGAAEPPRGPAPDPGAPDPAGPIAGAGAGARTTAWRAGDARSVPLPMRGGLVPPVTAAAGRG